MLEKSFKISVVIPTKNEEGGIKNLVEKCKKYSHEVVVIDGNSSDNTRVYAEEAGALVFLDNGKGKGAAYKLGLEKANHEIVVFIDGDGSHEPADIPKITEPINNKGYDFVVASRHKGGSDEWEGDLIHWLRSIGSGFLSLVINYRFKSKLTDVLNGFRAIKRDVGLKIPFNCNNFDIEQHMICQLLKHKYTVTEVGSHEYCRGWGKSKLPTFTKAYLFFGDYF